MDSTVQIFRNDLPLLVTDALGLEPMIACDLETSGLDWRTERIGTVQFHGINVGTVMVHNLVKRPANIISLIEKSSVSKVFHHAPFDLRFMAAGWSVQARNVRCTKIASKLLRPQFPAQEHSLAALLLSYLGVTITKGSIRTSDWTAPAISPEQVTYAANDVRFLLPLLSRLQVELAQAEREALFAACCDFLPTQTVLEIGAFPDVFSY